MDNHDQTKLEIALAAEEVANYYASMGTDIYDTVSEAFARFAVEIRERVEGTADEMSKGA